VDGDPTKDYDTRARDVRDEGRDGLQERLLETVIVVERRNGEVGSFAEKVKQQADIVRCGGEYVRLKKTGKDSAALSVSTRKRPLPSQFL